MIPKSVSPVQKRPWQSALASAFRQLPDLHGYLGLPPPSPAALAAAREFPILVTRYFADLVEHGREDDPLLRQILPTGVETLAVEGFCTDPLDEVRYSEAGVIRKYPGRVLWVMTGGCPVHCRYCFRRHFPYADHAIGRQHLEDVLVRIRDDRRVSEVILSGGDPLLLTDNLIAQVMAALAEVPHVRRVRIHTRVLNTLPSRIDDALMAALENWPRRLVVVTHANHPREVTPEMSEAVSRLRRADVLILNQSVLLRGVNDHLETLAALSAQLVDVGVQPYYLHLLDPVQGAAHFAVSEAEGQALIAGLIDRLSGYMVPTLVREVPERLAKTRIPVNNG